MQQYSLQPDVVGHHYCAGPPLASFRLGQGFLILAAIPLSVAKNGFRIFTLSVLAVYVDPSFLHGRLHHQGGIVFFLVFLAGLSILLWLVRWAERKLMAQQPAVTKLATPIAVSKATPDNFV